jgi:hypothetical protein
MDHIERARAKSHYRNYWIARDAHLNHIDNDDVYQQWTVAHAAWVRTMRDLRIGRLDREEIHEEVVAELRDVL